MGPSGKEVCKRTGQIQTEFLHFNPLSGTTEPLLLPWNMERIMGFGPMTYTLATYRSTWLSYIRTCGRGPEAWRPTHGPRDRRSDLARCRGRSYSERWHARSGEFDKPLGSFCNQAS